MGRECARAIVISLLCQSLLSRILYPPRRVCLCARAEIFYRWIYIYTRRRQPPVAAGNIIIVTFFFPTSFFYPAARRGGRKAHYSPLPTPRKTATVLQRIHNVKRRLFSVCVSIYMYAFIRDIPTPRNSLTPFMPSRGGPRDDDDDGDDNDNNMRPFASNSVKFSWTPLPELRSRRRRRRRRRYSGNPLHVLIRNCYSDPKSGVLFGITRQRCFRYYRPVVVIILCYYVLMYTHSAVIGNRTPPTAFSCGSKYNPRGRGVGVWWRVKFIISAGVNIHSHCTTAESPGTLMIL